MIEEYHEIFGLQTVINRCGVLTGSHQMGKVDQGVVVLWMAKHFWKKNLGYFGYGGSGKQTRDILHVKDLFNLLDIQIHQIEKFDGEIFNIGGTRKVSASLQELTQICQEISGNKIPIEAVAETRKADIKIYISDCNKIKKLAEWEPVISISEILEEIFEWLRKNEKQLKPILS